MMGHSFAGHVHLASACLALLFGTIVIGSVKGTKTHRWMGYSYSVSMVVVNATAFMIYRLFGGWGPFHLAAMISLTTLLLGMIPVILKSPKGAWLRLHFSFMYYSVIGLYAAFFSELITRLMPGNFGLLVGLATGLTLTAGMIVFQSKHKKWQHSKQTL